jgi:redox-sensitive bicupin YhaK (pirin superfamily)
VSNLEPQPQESASAGAVDVAPTPVRDLLPGREVVLGGTRGLAVTRSLPTRDRRMVGAWCFVDHFGPADVSTGGGMRVGPHPHTGLQTVTWLVEGQVRHTDSVGSDQLIRPGQLNLMTAGRGIAHAEQSPPDAPAVLHGLQLWVALPDAYRRISPHFEHHRDLPRMTIGDAVATVLIGELGGTASPATAYTPIVGAELALPGGGQAAVPLVEGFEYAALTIDGTAEVDGTVLAPGSLLYLGCGRSELPVQAAGPARVLVLGGEPFVEEILMWWNFVARTHDEIVAAREDWMAGPASSFGKVRGYDGDPLPAPALPGTPLKPRGRAR